MPRPDPQEIAQPGFGRCVSDYSSPGWVATAKQLREKVAHHLDEEEHEVFQMAGKVLSDGEKESLATQYRQAMSNGQ